jgi:hypothetical protein
LPCAAEGDEHFGPPCRLVYPELERGAEKLRRSVEGERVNRGAAGRNVVFDRTPRFAKRGGGGEMTREVSEGAHGSPSGGFKRLSNTQVELGSAHPREPVIYRSPNQLVRKSVDQATPWQLLDNPAAHRFVERGEKLTLCQPAAAPDDRALALSGGAGTPYVGTTVTAMPVSFLGRPQLGTPVSFLGRRQLGTPVSFQRSLSQPLSRANLVRCRRRARSRGSPPSTTNRRRQRKCSPAGLIGATARLALSWCSG